MDRGDIYHVDLNPTRGREQAGPRYVLVVTRKAFNNLATPLVCPISQRGDFARNAGFAVSLIGTGTKVQGVVLCNEPRVLDLKERGGKRIRIFDAGRWDGSRTAGIPVAYCVFPGRLEVKMGPWESISITLAFCFRRGSGASVSVERSRLADSFV